MMTSPGFFFKEANLLYKPCYHLRRSNERKLNDFELKEKKKSYVAKKKKCKSQVSIFSDFELLGNLTVLDKKSIYPTLHRSEDTRLHDASISMGECNTILSAY